MKTLDDLDWSSPMDHVKDLDELYWTMWPADERKGFDKDILVAGCGTNLAAIYAYRYRDARVVGIDISESSLANEQRLKELHSLQNLELHQLPVERAAELGRDFDYVSVTGVLHHMADPVAGLAALRDVLRREGVINVMVYGRHGRYAVYMLQDFFRILGLGPTEEGLRMVKQTLKFVDPAHPIRPYMQSTGDVKSNAGLVDTFLHQRDVAYDVAGCLKLCDDAGVAFGGWQEPFLYHPDAQLPAGTPLFERLERLPERQLWAAVELFHGGLTLHAFNCCRRDRPEANYRVHFSGPKLLDQIPVRRERTTVQRDDAAKTVSLTVAPFPAIGLDPLRTRLFEAIDGQRTVRQCAGLVPQLPQEASVDLFSRLGRIGYCLFRLIPH
jgi:SAM-dependent methyltransferase